MDCARIDLIAYHFGTLDDEGRGHAEQHLFVCSRCLRAYLDLKRHADGRGRAELPGESVRARLRKDVERSFAAPVRQKRLGWLSRPIPLYQGLAAATLAILISVLAPAVVDRARAARLAGGSPVDTSRRSAESLTIY